MARSSSFTEPFFRKRGVKKRGVKKRGVFEVRDMSPDDEQELVAYHDAVQQELGVKYFLLDHNREVREEMAKNNMVGIPGITKAIQAIVKEIATLLLKREGVEAELAKTTTKTKRGKTNPLKSAAKVAAPKKAKKKGPKKES